jgi:hypothetical protein
MMAKSRYETIVHPAEQDENGDEVTPAREDPDWVVCTECEPPSNRVPLIYTSEHDKVHDGDPEEEAKKTKRDKAVAKLKKMGLTEEDLASLFPDILG